MSASSLLLIVVSIFVLGVGSQLLADKYKVPSIIFLLTAGILAGPEVLNIVNPDAFGQGLQLVVGLAVAIIVFEGSFHLKINKLRVAQKEAIRLGTVGAVISLVLTAVAAYYTLGVTWNIAFLIGALLIATGPTVINPLLDVVPVRKRVEAALETEGIVNDVTAAILALVVYEFVVLESGGLQEILIQFVTRWGSGLFIGGIVALTAYYLLETLDLEGSKEGQDARIIVLGAALVSYGIAELIITEAGIAAVATAGIILGNLDIPHKKEIREFEDALSVFVLSFVFIALAALLEFQNLLTLGLGGLIFVLAVTLVVRPVTVYLSCYKGCFSSQEKVFISLVGPRGIIPASVATLFALELQNAGRPEAAATIVGAVFIIILATSFIEGGMAKYLAKKLDVIPMHTIIIGAGESGLNLAEKLEERGEGVTVIESDSNEVEKAKKKGLNVIQGDGRDEEILREAEAGKAKIIATMTHDDDVNMVVSQMAKSKFGTENIIARVNEPANKSAFEDLGVKHISSPEAIADSFENMIENPALWKQLTEHRDKIEIAEVKSERSFNSVKEVQDLLPNNCLINLISRDGKALEPTEVSEITTGDKITLIGKKEALEEAKGLFY